jgi:ABC-type branched-subunit amino acid transport system substrate-binding protein
MIRPNIGWRTAVVLATASLALSACGSSDDSSDKKSSSSSDKSSSTAKSGDGTLTIGTLLPQTGDLAFLGPPEIAGVDLAIKEVNDGGGVNGKPIKEYKSDSGDGTPDIAGASVDGLLDNKADVIVGAASSNVSKSVIDKITGAGVVQFSPANTAAGFDTYPDKGLYFRTAPSDLLQGKVVANQAVKDGNKNIAVLARQDFYGSGLADSAAKNVTAAGANLAKKVLYNADAENFTAEVNEIAASKPDALILVSFDEAKKIIPALDKKGIGPQDIKLYLVDGDLADYSGNIGAFKLDGVKGTAPSPAEFPADFKKQILGVDPKVKDFTYAPESYDVVMLSALAALEAKDDGSKSIAEHIVDVSKDGTQCTGWKECSDLVKKGEDIDYQGVSGPADMNDSGSLSKGTIGIFQYKKGNTYAKIDSVSGLVG